MGFIRKLLCLLLTVVLLTLCISNFSNVKVKAYGGEIPKPKITVKTLKNGTDVKITISKTKQAEGYYVYYEGPNTDLSQYRGVTEVSGLIKNIKKNGKAKRSFTVKSLPAGTYSFYAQAYNDTKLGKRVYSEYSAAKYATVSDDANGYKNSYDFSKVQKGDIIAFGKCEQDDNYTNGMEPIEWVVIDKTDDSLLVASRYLLHCIPYNKGNENVTWENCTLRKWLNGMFLNNSFNSVEKNMIMITIVKNEDNAAYQTDGGNDTLDKVFLFSQKDMINSSYGFDTDYDYCDMNRRCSPTKFAKNWGCTADRGSDFVDGKYVVREGNEKTSDGGDSCHYWLRTPGSSNANAAGVRADGHVGNCLAGFSGPPYVDYDFNFICRGVRPVMNISITS